MILPRLLRDKPLVFGGAGLFVGPKAQGDMEKLDPDLLYEQIETCAEVVSRLDLMTPAEIGQNAYQNPDFPSR